MESRGNGNTVLLTVVGVATLLVALVGATFAYFSATVSNDAAQSISVYTASPASLQYAGGSGISIENAQPGDSDSATFTITNPSGSTIAQKYSLKLVVDLDGFTTTHTHTSNDNGDATHINKPEGTEQPNQLMLTVTGPNAAAGKYYVDGSASGAATSASYDLTDGATMSASGANEFYLVKDVTIDAAPTTAVEHQYTTSVTFENLRDTEDNTKFLNQDENKGAAFSAHIIIADVAPINANQQP